MLQLNGLDLQKFYDTLKDDENLDSKAPLKNYMTAARQFLLYLERLDAATPGIVEKVHLPTLEKEDGRRNEEIEPDRVKETVDHLDRFQNASCDHIILLLHGGSVLEVAASTAWTSTMSPNLMGMARFSPWSIGRLRRHC